MSFGEENPLDDLSFLIYLYTNFVIFLILLSKHDECIQDAHGSEEIEPFFWRQLKRCQQRRVRSKVKLQALFQTSKTTEDLSLSHSESLREEMGNFESFNSGREGPTSS